jgi:hypothetical protein
MMKMKLTIPAKHLAGAILLIIPFEAIFLQAAERPSIAVGVFKQEARTEFKTEHGLPANQISSVAVLNSSTVFAGTAQGLARFTDGRWDLVKGTEGRPVEAVTAVKGKVLFAAGGVLQSIQEDKLESIAPLPAGMRVNSISAGETIYLATDQGLFEHTGAGLKPVAALNEVLGNDRAVFQVALGTRMMVGAAAGLFQREKEEWTRLFPADEAGRSWALIHVRGVAYDTRGRLWFASPQGAGRWDGAWTLFSGAEGLPSKEFTTMAAGEDGVVWFGTRMGAIRYDGRNWEYRQGRRWLPDDRVHGIAVTAEGNAWFATAEGLSLIERRPMTLARKAEFYENQIDAVHRRTPWEYVLHVTVPTPGTTNQFTQHDSDNDGLWTSMYGAGQCFAYGATKDPLAKQRAQKAFEALRWLGEVTQGGEHSPPPGYVARTILPTSGPDPNAGRLEGDKRKKAEQDALWKLYEPRWPKSQDGKWYWKSDTSSDELDGHFFFYPLYHDLVCETEEERGRLREQMRALMDHLISHDFNLVDHDGHPTRWGIYNPQSLNRDPFWSEERGLKSLSLLSYLAATEHVTGDPKYREIINRLREEHHYDTNLKVPKIQRGVGSGNQSDDEMAFMCFYNLMKYGNDPTLIHEVGYTFYSYWILEFPEMNPFFNFAYAAFGIGRKYTNPWGTHDISPWEGWLEDSVDTLKRFPLDRFDWRHTNSRRLDLVPLMPQTDDPYSTGRSQTGYRVNGKVIPVDERFFNHWNHNPFALDTGGSGHVLADGAVFLLPYYMGLYHGFLKEGGTAN